MMSTLSNHLSSVINSGCILLYLINFVCRKAGVLGFADMGKKGLDSYLDSMRVNNLPFKFWTGDEANRAYPRQLKVHPSCSCIYEEDGGVLKASVGLRALQVYIYI